MIQMQDQFIDLVRASLYFHFHTAILQISDPAGEFQQTGFIGGMVPESYPLYTSIEQKMCSDQVTPQ